MTKLKYTIALTDSCELVVTDTTGFKPSTDGFVTEDALTIPVGEYKLSNGYFLDLITVQTYRGAPTIALTGNLLSIASENVEPIYSDNFASLTYKLSQDSTFTINRFFIMSQAFYNANLGSGRFDGLTVYYSDGTDIYQMIDGEAVKISPYKLFSDSDTESTNLYTKITFTSICYLKRCHQYLINLVLTKGCATCEDDVYKKQRDLIYMSLQSIEYLEELGYTTEIQKIIEMLDVCGGICGDNRNNSDCGCNG